MRRVLMLCYYFPPIIASGTTRSISFAKNLSQFGWEPVILTVKETMDPWVNVGKQTETGVETHRSHEWNLGGACDLLHGVSSKLASFAGVDLQTNWMRELFCVPDQQIAWLSSAPGRKLAHSCDVVYASCSPFSSAVSACVIKRLTGKPAVVDFRDAWTLNPHVRHSKFHTAIIRRQEEQVVERVDRMILNTKGAGKLYRERYPRHSAKFEVIPNGYDELTPVTGEAGDKFTIMHIGSFYGSRSPRLLLEAISELSELNIELVQVGGELPGVESFRGKFPIEVHGSLPRDQAMEMMQKASLLYLKQGFEEGVTDYIAVAAKTYEYLATGLPILAEVPPGDNADIVREYGSRAYVVTSQSKEDIKSALRCAHAHRLEVPLELNPRFVEDFSRKRLTEKLAGLFDAVVGT